MGTETERKFLLNEDFKVEDITDKGYVSTTRHIIQGYLSTNDQQQVRVRRSEVTIMCTNKSHVEYEMTIKGGLDGIDRSEINIEIEIEEDAISLLKMCSHNLEKIRYVRECGELELCIDNFLTGTKKGETIIEIEFEPNDIKQLYSYNELKKHLPDWVGKEITYDASYYNVNMAPDDFFLAPFPFMPLNIEEGEEQ